MDIEAKQYTFFYIYKSWWFIFFKRKKATPLLKGRYSSKTHCNSDIYNLQRDLVSLYVPKITTTATFITIAIVLRFSFFMVAFPNLSRSLTSGTLLIMTFPGTTAITTIFCNIHNNLLSVFVDYIFMEQHVNGCFSAIRRGDHHSWFIGWRCLVLYNGLLVEAVLLDFLPILGCFLVVSSHQVHRYQR